MVGTVRSSKNSISLNLSMLLWQKTVGEAGEKQCLRSLLCIDCVWAWFWVVDFSWFFHVLLSIGGMRLSNIILSKCYMIWSVCLFPVQGGGNLFLRWHVTFYPGWNHHVDPFWPKCVFVFQSRIKKVTTFPLSAIVGQSPVRQLCIRNIVF